LEFLLLSALLKVLRAGNFQDTRGGSMGSPWRHAAIMEFCGTRVRQRILRIAGQRIVRKRAK